MMHRLFRCNNYPNIFVYLRIFENINIDESAASFLIKNNKYGISESQDKSGNFYYYR